MTDLNTARELAHAAALSLPWVQVRIQSVTTCARLLDTFTTRDQIEFSKLDLHTPFKGIAHYPSNRVRPCSGVDGRCFCSDEAIQPMAQGLCGVAAASPVCDSVPSAAAARSAPLGNHGEITGITTYQPYRPLFSLLEPNRYGPHSKILPGPRR